MPSALLRSEGRLSMEDKSKVSPPSSKHITVFGTQQKKVQKGWMKCEVLVRMTYRPCPKVHPKPFLSSPYFINVMLRNNAARFQISLKFRFGICCIICDGTWAANWGFLLQKPVKKTVVYLSKLSLQSHIGKLCLFFAQFCKITKNVHIIDLKLEAIKPHTSIHFYSLNMIAW